MITVNRVPEESDNAQKVEKKYAMSHKDFQSPPPVSRDT